MIQVWTTLYLFNLLVFVRNQFDLELYFLLSHKKNNFKEFSAKQTNTTEKVSLIFNLKTTYKNLEAKHIYEEYNNYCSLFRKTFLDM